MTCSQLAEEKRSLRMRDDKRRPRNFYFRIFGTGSDLGNDDVTVGKKEPT